jgi:hypothetical protein
MKSFHLFTALIGAVCLCFLAIVAAVSWALGSLDAAQNLVIGGAIVSIFACACLSLAAFACESFLNRNKNEDTI